VRSERAQNKDYWSQEQVQIQKVKVGTTISKYQKQIQVKGKHNQNRNEDELSSIMGKVCNFYYSFHSVCFKRLFPRWLPYLQEWPERNLFGLLAAITRQP